MNLVTISNRFPQTIFNQREIAEVGAQQQKRMPRYRLELRIPFSDTPKRSGNYFSQPVNFLDVRPE